MMVRTLIAWLQRPQSGNRGTIKIKELANGTIKTIISNKRGIEHPFLTRYGETITYGLKKGGSWDVFTRNIASKQTARSTFSDKPVNHFGMHWQLSEKGKLIVEIVDLPNNASGSIKIEGDSYSKSFPLSERIVIDNLLLGTYKIVFPLIDLEEGITYVPSQLNKTINIESNQTTKITIQYSQGEKFLTFEDGTFEEVATKVSTKKSVTSIKYSVVIGGETITFNESIPEGVKSENLEAYVQNNYINEKLPFYLKFMDRAGPLLDSEQLKAQNFNNSNFKIRSVTTASKDDPLSISDINNTYYNLSPLIDEQVVNHQTIAMETPPASGSYWMPDELKLVTCDECLIYNGKFKKVIHLEFKWTNEDNLKKLIEDSAIEGLEIKVNFQGLDSQVWANKFTHTQTFNIEGVPYPGIPDYPEISTYPGIPNAAYGSNLPEPYLDTRYLDSESHYFSIGTVNTDQLKVNTIYHWSILGGIDGTNLSTPTSVVVSPMHTYSGDVSDIPDFTLTRLLDLHPTINTNDHLDVYFRIACEQGGIFLTWCTFRNIGYQGIIFFSWEIASPTGFGGFQCSPNCGIEDFILVTSLKKEAGADGKVEFEGENNPSLQRTCNGGIVECTGVFDFREKVTLTAVPLPNSVFVGWSGACSGLSQVCTTIMDERQKRVTANFATKTTPPPQPPQPPEEFNLNFNDLRCFTGDPAVKLYWGSSLGATGYALYRNGVLYKVLNSSTTSFDNQVGLVAGQTYKYLVEASNNDGKVTSNLVSVTIPNDICESNNSSNAPAKPDLLLGEYCNEGAATVFMGWQPDSTVDYYRVFINGVELPAEPEIKISYFLWPLNKGENMSVKVTAVNSKGSKSSDTESITMPFNVCSGEAAEMQRLDPNDELKLRARINETAKERITFQNDDDAELDLYFTFFNVPDWIEIRRHTGSVNPDDDINIYAEAECGSAPIEREGRLAFVTTDLTGNEDLIIIDVILKCTEPSPDMDDLLPNTINREAQLLEEINTSLSFINDGDADLHFSISTPSWIDVSPLQGSLSPDGKQTVAVTLNCNNKEEILNDDIEVSTNGGYDEIDVTLTCKNPEPIQEPPSITSFTASPNTIQEGQSSTLSWSVTGAQPINFSIDQGVGSVAGANKSVSPITTKTYTLTASNSVGSVQKTVTVNVTALPVAPTITSFTASPNTIQEGQSSTPFVECYRYNTHQFKH